MIHSILNTFKLGIEKSEFSEVNWVSKLKCISHQSSFEKSCFRIRLSGKMTKYIYPTVEGIGYNRVRVKRVTRTGYSFLRLHVETAAAGTYSSPRSASPHSCRLN